MFHPRFIRGCFRSAGPTLMAQSHEFCNTRATRGVADHQKWSAATAFAARLYGDGPIVQQGPEIVNALQKAEHNFHNTDYHIGYAKSRSSIISSATNIASDV
jgi:hypothetical protein